jgi:hypothetical protein
MADRELVLELGVEGGGATIYRTPLVSGRWQFHVEGTSMYLDENDDEGWRSWRTEPVLNIEEALASVANDGSWVFFYPVKVHHEYRTIVWQLVQAEASKLSEGRIKMWQRRSHDWQHLCQQEPE